MLPPWPGWDGLHPLVIHFPIALFLVAPVFVAVAMVQPRRTAAYAWPAVVLLALGTLAAFVAVASGEAAAELATRTEAVNRVLDRHASLAETARNVFALLTVAYAVAVWGVLRWRRLARPAYASAVHALFLVLLLAASSLVAAAAHQGGLLVHGLGVHSMVSVPSPDSRSLP